MTKSVDLVANLRKNSIQLKWTLMIVKVAVTRQPSGGSDRTGPISFLSLSQWIDGLHRVNLGDLWQNGTMAWVFGRNFLL